MLRPICVNTPHFFGARRLRGPTLPRSSAPERRRRPQSRFTRSDPFSGCPPSPRRCAKLRTLRRARAASPWTRSRVPLPRTHAPAIRAPPASVGARILPRWRRPLRLPLRLSGRPGHSRPTPARTAGLSATARARIAVGLGSEPRWKADASDSERASARGKEAKDG